MLCQCSHTGQWEQHERNPHCSHHPVWLWWQGSLDSSLTLTSMPLPLLTFLLSLSYIEHLERKSRWESRGLLQPQYLFLYFGWCQATEQHLGCATYRLSLERGGEEGVFVTSTYTGSLSVWHTDGAHGSSCTDSGFGQYWWVLLIHWDLSSFLMGLTIKMVPIFNCVYTWWLLEVSASATCDGVDSTLYAGFRAFWE